MEHDDGLEANEGREEVEEMLGSSEEAAMVMQLLGSGWAGLVI